MNNNDYIRNSLELHLFFDRIMKEHSFFLEIAFTKRDANLMQIAKNFQITFANFLKRAISLSDGNVNNELINSQEIVTKNTINAENKTNNLTGSRIDTNITRRELNLRSGNIMPNEMLTRNISNLNNQTLIMLERLIDFKTNVLNNVLSCNMFTSNYPLLIKHLIKETKMYQKLLTKVESKSFLTKQELAEQELFWNDIMKEHALFIRGGIDPTEEVLFLKSNQFAEEYKNIINNYNPSISTTQSLKETINFRNFKIAGEEGILNCKIQSIIIPLLADHVVREANHFIRILNNLTMIK